jgi:phage shock protein C
LENEPRIDPVQTPPSDYQPGYQSIRRSRSDRVIAGVCGGLGRYLNIDPIVVRIAFVALVFAGGSGVLLYILAWIIIPEESETDAARPVATVSGDRGRLIAGGVLIVIGAFLLIRVVIPWFDERVVWAVILIGAGLALVLRGSKR